MFSFQLTLNFVALGLLTFFVRRAWIRSRRLPLPPGPKGWPVIGNIFDIPKEKAHIAYMEMGRKYSTWGCLIYWDNRCWSTRFTEHDMIYLNVVGTSMLILNSVEAANDLFVARATSYSNRFAGQDYRFTLFSWSMIGRVFQCSVNCKWSSHCLLANSHSA